jgi:hypothetical protein
LFLISILSGKFFNYWGVTVGYLNVNKRGFYLTVFPFYHNVLTLVISLVIKEILRQDKFNACHHCYKTRLWKVEWLKSCAA